MSSILRFNAAQFINMLPLDMSRVIYSEMDDTFKHTFESPNFKKEVKNAYLKLNRALFEQMIDFKLLSILNKTDKYTDIFWHNELLKLGEVHLLSDEVAVLPQIFEKSDWEIRWENPENDSQFFRVVPSNYEHTPTSSPDGFVCGSEGRNMIQLIWADGGSFNGRKLNGFNVDNFYEYTLNTNSSGETYYLYMRE